MQLRGNMANDHETMSRTQLQRVYEIRYFRDQYARAHGRDKASTANIAAEYAKVRMAKGREAVTKSFIDAALTIHARVLSIPNTEQLLLDIDNLPRQTNPFNSVHRLQAIGPKRKNSKENILWVLEHIRHMVGGSDPAGSSEFSVEALRGSPKSGNRGLVDVIVLNKEALGHLCHKLPFELGFEGDSAWLSNVRTHLKDHASSKASKGTDGLTQHPEPGPRSLRGLWENATTNI